LNDDGPPPLSWPGVYFEGHFRCTGNEVHRTTNADLSFGALTARRLNADYQINAFSGRGMVRNYNGGDPGTDYRTYYDRALLAVTRSSPAASATWSPPCRCAGDTVRPRPPGATEIR
jgi:hypothetical protein